MVLQATPCLILLRAAWLFTSKAFLFVVHNSYMIDKRLPITKLLATAWFYAGVRFLLVMHTSDVLLKEALLTKYLVTLWHLAMEGRQVAITVQDSDVFVKTGSVPKLFITTRLRASPE